MQRKITLFFKPARQRGANFRSFSLPVSRQGFLAIKAVFLFSAFLFFSFGRTFIAESGAQSHSEPSAGLSTDAPETDIRKELAEAKKEPKAGGTKSANGKNMKIQQTEKAKAKKPKEEAEADHKKTLSADKSGGVSESTDLKSTLSADKSEGGGDRPAELKKARNPSSSTAYSCSETFQDEYSPGYIQLGYGCPSSAKLCMAFYHIERNRCQGDNLIRYYCHPERESLFSQKEIKCLKGCVFAGLSAVCQR